MHTYQSRRAYLQCRQIYVYKSDRYAFISGYMHVCICEYSLASHNFNKPVATQHYGASSAVFHAIFSTKKSAYPSIGESLRIYATTSIYFHFINTAIRLHVYLWRSLSLLELSEAQRNGYSYILTWIYSEINAYYSISLIDIHLSLYTDRGVLISVYMYVCNKPAACLHLSISIWGQPFSKTTLRK